MSDEYIKKGKAFKFGDNISTDHIAPGRLFHLRNDLAEFSKHVLEDADPEFAKKVQKGGRVVHCLSSFPRRRFICNRLITVMPTSPPIRNPIMKKRNSNRPVEINKKIFNPSPMLINYMIQLIIYCAGKF